MTPPPLAAQRSPSDIARETIRQLALRRLPPTPGNYAQIWAELAGAPQNNQADWGNVIRNLVRQWDVRHPVWTPGRKRESLEHVLNAFGEDGNKLAQRLTNLVRSWSERGIHSASDTVPLSLDAANTITPITPIAAITPAPQSSGRIEVAGLPAAGATAGSNPGNNAGNSAGNNAGNSQVEAANGVSLAPPAGSALVPAVAAAAAVASADRYAASQPAAAGTAGAAGTVGAVDNAAFTAVRDLCTELLKLSVGQGAVGDERLQTRASGLIERLKAAHTSHEMNHLAPALRDFVRSVELRRGAQQDRIDGLISLLHLIVSNIEELVPDSRWVKGQVERLRDLISGPLDSRTLSEAEQAFRDVLLRQGRIRKSIDEAKAALRDMLTSFIDRIDVVSESTGEYQGKIKRYADSIEQVDDLSQLPGIIKDLLADTRAVQSDMVRAREELIEARQRAQSYELEVAQLERELADVSKLVKSDELTQVLNRRGLNEAMEIEAARSDRDGTPLSVALLDVDNFKLLNDTHGHDVGDSALKHLAKVVRQTVRPTDIVARFGGEEFVVLLPDTRSAEAAEVMVRVQRQLTRNYFLENNSRLLITFSAGVTERQAKEDMNVVVARADEALYKAKDGGKNLVVRL